MIPRNMFHRSQTNRSGGGDETHRRTASAANLKSAAAREAGIVANAVRWLTSLPRDGAARSPV
ncbi:hypothetical protein D3C86_1627460 [compost metagenome]